MKQIILILFLSLQLGISSSQQRAVLPTELKDLSLKADYIRPFSSASETPGYKGPNQLHTITGGGFSIEETDIGTSFYDLQSNASLSNRIHCYDDGTIGAVWTIGMQATSFPDRGTGYNYFNGATWGTQPQQRIETLRTGWPSYAPWGPGGEIVVSHDFGAFQLYFNSRPQKGTGTWTQTLFEYTNGPTTLAWPRMTTSGEDNNTVHLLACTYGEYQGQTVGLVYSRSLDGGATWDLENEVLDEMGSDYYLEINADQYIWANPVGETIAFLAAGAWHDLFMMKSTDNGESWEKTVIWEHPYPFFDWNVTITDTFFCVDNSASIALGPDGKAHVAFGISRVIHSAVGTTYNYYPFVDGIGYWNEDMPTFSNDLNALAPPQYGYPTTELVEDYNYIGWTQDVDGDGEITFVTTSTGFPMSYREMGLSTMPAIAVSPENWVMIVFASTTETFDNFDWNYKKLWMRSYMFGAWGPFEHLTQDIMHIFDESVYPTTYPAWDGSVHLLYNNDGSPGTGLDGDHDYIENRITYMKIENWIGVDENDPKGLENASMVIYPNPASDHMKIGYSISHETEISIVITDVTGKTMVNQSLGNKKAGDHMNSIDLSGLKNGIYFVNLEHDNLMTSQKLVKY